MSACLFWPFFWRISATEGEANQMWTSTASILSVVLFNIEAAELTVRYYNEAKVSTKALAFAVETANRTLRQAGVKARWIDCYVEAAACKGDVEAAVRLDDVEHALGLLLLRQEQLQALLERGGGAVAPRNGYFAA